MYKFQIHAKWTCVADYLNRKKDKAKCTAWNVLFWKWKWKKKNWIEEKNEENSEIYEKCHEKEFMVKQIL